MITNLIFVSRFDFELNQKIKSQDLVVSNVSNVWPIWSSWWCDHDANVKSHRFIYWEWFVCWLADVLGSWPKVLRGQLQSFSSVMTSLTSIQSNFLSDAFLSCIVISLGAINQLLLSCVCYQISHVPGSPGFCNFIFSWCKWFLNITV